MSRRATIDTDVDSCGDDCPFYRQNDCADHGTTMWCEKDTKVDLNKFFRPNASQFFSRGKSLNFPENCPLDAED